MTSRRLGGIVLAVACLGLWLIWEDLSRGGAILATVPVGLAPAAIAVDAQAGRALVINADGTTVSVIDDRAGRAIGETTVGSNGGAHPVAIAADGRSRRAFIATDDGELSMLDSRTGLLLGTATTGGSSQEIAVDDAIGRAFESNLDSGTVGVIDTTTGALLRTVPVGHFPDQIVCSRRSGRVFVADRGDNAVAVLDARSGHLEEVVQVGDDPISMATSTALDRLYVGGAHGSITALDARTGAIRFRRMPFGHLISMIRPLIAADDPAGRVAVAINKRLVEIDPRSGTTRVTVHLSSAISALAVAPGTGYLLATVRGRLDPMGHLLDAGSLLVIDARGRILHTAQVGMDPSTIALDVRNGRVLVANTELNPDGSAIHRRAPSRPPLEDWLRHHLPWLSTGAVPPPTSGTVTVLRLDRLG